MDLFKKEKKGAFTRIYHVLGLSFVINKKPPAISKYDKP